MFVTLQLSADLAALLCGTLMRAADQYPDSPNQRELFEKIETAVEMGWRAVPRASERPASDRVVAEIKGRLPVYTVAKGELAAQMCADIYFLLNERAALSQRRTTDECS